MKQLLFLLIAIWFSQHAFSENSPGKYALNLKLSFPILKSDVPQFIQSVEPGLDVLYLFPLINNIRMGTGIGIEYGHHVWNKLYTGVTRGNGEQHKYHFLYVYHYNFISAEIPLNFIIPIKTRFINALNFDFDFGWHFKTDFSVDQVSLYKEPEMNKTYMSSQAGVQMPLFKFKQIQFNIQPSIKYRFYLTDNNEFKTNYFSIGINLNTRIDRKKIQTKGERTKNKNIRVEGGHLPGPGHL